MLSVNPCSYFYLKTGGMTIGVLQIVNGIMLIITSFMALGVAAHKDCKRHGQDATVITTLWVIDAEIWLINGILFCVFGIILLCAIQQKSEYLLKVWIIFQSIMLILSIGLSVIVFAIAFTWTILILFFINILLSSWFISVGYNLRKEIT